MEPYLGVSEIYDFVIVTITTEIFNAAINKCSCRI